MAMLGDLDLERLLDALKWQESGRLGQKAVSPKGARTAYGIMPATAADPGYGVQPRNIGMLVSDENAARDFSRDYLLAMYEKTGSPEAALAAYNGGLGRGLAFKRGGRVPTETANYVPAVLSHYKRGVPGATAAAPTAGRMRWDELMQKFSPMSEAHAAQSDPTAALFHPSITPTMAGPKPQDRLTPDAAPAMPAADTDPRVEAGSVNTFSPTDPGTLAQNFAPPAMPLGTDGEMSPTQSPSGAGGEDYLPKIEEMYKRNNPNKWAGLGDAMMQIGGGLMESGGMRGMTAATRGAAVSRAHAREMEADARKAELAMLGPTMAYKAYVESGMDPKEAFLYAINPSAAPKWNTEQIGEDASGRKRYAQTNQFGQTRPVPGVPSNDDGPELSGQELLDSIEDPNEREIVSRLSKWEYSPKDLSIRGNKRARYLALASRVNPDLNPMDYDRIFAARKAYAADGKYSNALRSADTAINHIGEMMNEFEELNKRAGGPADSGHWYSKTYNDARGWALGQQADEALTGVGSPVQAVASELAKLYKGVGVVPHEEIEEWKESVHANMSPQQQQHSVKVLLGLLAGAMHSYKQNYESAVGPAYAAAHPFEEVFKFSGEARRILDKFKVAVPGHEQAAAGDEHEAEAAETPTSGASGVPAGIPSQHAEVWEHYSDEEKAFLLKKYGAR